MLEADGLVCERGGRILFRDLSLRLGPGATVRIAGANGRGKTSLLRILCGLLTPSGGQVRWQGSSITTLKEEFAKQLVYLGHAPAVKNELTAAENLVFACALSGVRVGWAAMDEALARFGVPPRQPVGKLSQGQRRRAALARLAVSDAVPLWLLDEPLAALDTEAAALVESLVSAHAARGGMVFFTTHQDSRIASTREVSLDG